MDFIKDNVSKGLNVGMLRIDVQKALGVSTMKPYVKKLKRLIDPELFCSYLSGRFQPVTLNVVQSVPLKIMCGLPQCSLFCPLLYLIYINDMEIMVKHKLLLGADESIILVCHKNPQVISQYLSGELDSVNDWLIDNKLSYHVGKTECILFGSKLKFNRFKDLKVYYKDHVIKGSKYVKYLGAILDQDHFGNSIEISLTRAPMVP